LINKELQTKWIEALESGKYNQGKNFLKVCDGGEFKYCCLGLLCELKGIPSETEQKNSTASKNIFTFGPRTTMITDELGQEVGLRNTQLTDLAHMNDSGKSFNEIAQEIKRIL